MSGEELLIKFGINAAILFALYFPLGQLYRKRLVKTWQVAVVGAIAGAAIGLVLSGPGFDPIGPAIFATLALAAVAGVSSYGWMRWFDRVREGIEHSRKR